MEDYKNFYQVAGTIKEEKIKQIYVERKADQDLLNSLLNNIYCHVFNSRQMGKSCLLSVTKKRLESYNIKCCTVSFQAIGGATEEQWYKTFIKRGVFKNFELKDKINFDEWWESNSGITYVGLLDIFINEVLLKYIKEKIVIFIDEIDKILSESFRDDFFGFIRECHERRSYNPEYKRLTFCLVGVATPNDLIQNSRITSYNISKGIELKGFDKESATKKLAIGLKDVANDDNHEEIFEQIFKWSDGQPFLTQALCSFLINSNITISKGEEKNKIKDIVENKIINNGEDGAINTHLKTIENRIIYDDDSTILLATYQNIIREGNFIADNDDYEKLRLSGLVIKKNKYLKVFNPIYNKFFNQEWITKKLKNSPSIEYREKKLAWEASSTLEHERDKSLLLYGIELEKTKKYKNLSEGDKKFIRKSQDECIEDRRELQAHKFKQDETKDRIISRIIHWTNRQPKLFEKLIEIVNKKLEVSEKNPNNLEEKVDDLVIRFIIDNDQEIGIINEIKQKIRNIPEKERFWLLIIYHKILHPSPQENKLKVSDSHEQQELEKLGLVRKRYEYVENFDAYWEVANKVYTEQFDENWVEDQLNDLRLKGQELDDEIAKADRERNLNKQEDYFLLMSMIWNMED